MKREPYTLAVTATATVKQQTRRVRHKGDVYDWCDEYATHYDAERGEVVVQVQMGDGTWTVLRLPVEAVAQSARDALRERHRLEREERERQARSINRRVPDRA